MRKCAVRSARYTWGQTRRFCKTLPLRGVPLFISQSRLTVPLVKIELWPKSNEESTYQLQSQVVVHRDLDILFGAERTLGGLDGRVPEQELDLFQIPSVLPAELGAGAAQVWAPKCSIPICFDNCSTTDQTAQSLSVSRLILPLLETDRSSRPSSIPAAVLQASMPCSTQMGMATVRMRRLEE
jgi:hypothetical protein